MNLVSCRNLLIYMNPSLQARVIPVFHYSLVPGGILLLGGAESVAQHANLFETVDKQARIFRRIEGRSPELSLSWPQPDLTSQYQRWASDHVQNAIRALPALGFPDMSAKSSTGAAGDKLKYPNFEHLLGTVAPSAEIVTQLQSALAKSLQVERGA